MRNLALGCGLVLVLWACGPATPELDIGTSVTVDGQDGGDERDGGIRILSDVAAPAVPDAARGRDGAGGAEGHDAVVTLDAQRDALEERPTPDAPSPVNDASPDRGGTTDARTTDARATDALVTTDASSDAAHDGRDARSDGAFLDADGPWDADGGADAMTARDATRDTVVPRDAPDRLDGAVDAIDEAVDAVDAVDAAVDVVPPAGHLLLTELVTRPSGAEFIEIMNPTPSPVVLSDYWLSDSHLYYEVALGTFATASGSDFAARFPDGAVLEPGGYAVVALGNASGGTLSFAATYGQAPDYELRPTANQATDDPAVPNMVAIGSSIGAGASLTDGGEPVVLYSYVGGDLVSDVDYVFYGTPSTSNPMVDKTGVVVGASMYLADTAPALQRATEAPSEAGSVHRCGYGESNETTAQGNGITGHDETSEDLTAAFRLGANATERTPGGPPPAGMCNP